jgi:endonuclease/exonuclease/phosphatase family metal-dependent hydrolase
VKRITALAAIVAAALFTAACEDVPGPGNTHNVVVLTRNVYVGTDVDQILLAQTPEELLARVEAAWQQLYATDFAERAEVLADEIGDVEPHLVGLQEITTFRTQSPGDAIVGGTVPAEDVVWDFLAILMDELAERGLHYDVAGLIEDTDVELPRGNETFDDVRMTDYDVVLVRSDVEYSHVDAANYTIKLPVPTPDGGTLHLLRGWVALDAEIGDETYRFVSTHLEPADYTDQVQLAEVAELLTLLSEETRTTILVGDLNSRADGSGTPTYGILTENGFGDAWIEGGAEGEAGMSCCHALDLRNEVPNLTERIDFILFRNGELAEAEAWVVGDELTDRTSSGMWPSDHAGVAARLSFVAQ